MADGFWAAFWGGAGGTFLVQVASKFIEHYLADKRTRAVEQPAIARDILKLFETFTRELTAEWKAPNAARNETLWRVQKEIRARTIELTSEPARQRLHDIDIIVVFFLQTSLHRNVALMPSTPETAAQRVLGAIIRGESVPSDLPSRASEALRLAFETMRPDDDHLYLRSDGST